MKTMKMIPLFVLALLFAAPAFSQSAACVYLKPGVSYAARAQILSDGFDFPWSDPFAVSNWRCFDLSSIPDGRAVFVRVSPVGSDGKVYVCKEKIVRSASSNVPVTFYDTGNLIKGADCQMFKQE